MISLESLPVVNTSKSIAVTSQRADAPSIAKVDNKAITDSLERFKDYLTEHGVSIKREKQTGDGTCLIVECPMNASHGHGTDTAIVYHNSGIPGFECKHNGCAGFTWKDVRQRIDPNYNPNPRGHVDCSSLLMPVTLDSDNAPSCMYLTDLGNSERFCAQHKENVRYIGDVGEWRIWDGHRWKRDYTGEVIALAKKTALSIYVEASNTTDSDMRHKLVKHAEKSQSDHSLSAMLHLAQSCRGIACTSEQFDRDDFLFNVQNGTLDLRTGRLREARREDYITRMAPVLYNPSAQCPRWTTFIAEIMNNDCELIGYLKRLTGMCLTGDYTEHILPVLHGDGRNGKSTFLDTVVALMGTEDGYAVMVADSLLTSTGMHEHPTGKADLWGARLAVASETDEGARLRVSMVKNLTGDAFQKARRMRQDYFTFRRTHKLFLCTNHKPVVKDQSVAIWQRLKLVPFTRQFLGDNADKSLSVKLHSEYSGILNWLIEGCLEWQQYGLGEPDQVKQATEAYRTEEDSFGMFIAECLDSGADCKLSRQELKQAYSEWAHRTGERDLPSRDLYANMRQRGYIEHAYKLAGATVRGFIGIGMKRSPDICDSVTDIAVPGD